MPARIDRRHAITGLGAVGLGAVLAACRAGDPAGESPSTTAGGSTVAPTGPGADLFAGGASCTLTPEQTEGPYYFDAGAIRRDIREDRPGVPLRLALRVQDAATCAPIPDAVVDIWHCDALGSYSGFEAASAGRPGAGSGRTDQSTYLRGAQVTGADGAVELLTIYPGWYRGRTTHIHAKVHLDRDTVLTSQLYFDEAVTAAVSAQAPYDADPGRDTFNDDDRIFDPELVMSLQPDGPGYLGVMSLGVLPT